MDPGKILMVDDDSVRRENAISALSAAGFSPITASGAAEAQQVFRREQPDLAIVAHSVASERIEVCRQLRACPEGTDLPIVVAAELEEATVAAAYEAGATDFVSVPMKFGLLTFRLPYLIRSARIQSDLRRTQDQLATAQRIAKLGHWSSNPDRDTVTLSREAARILGRRPETLVLAWDRFMDDVHDDDRHRVRRALTEMSPKASLRLEHRLAGDELTIVSQEVLAAEDAAGRLILTGTIQDISERKRAERHIVRLAYYDNLTGLPNQTFFYETLNNLVEQVDAGIALVSVHLKGLHRIVDTFGHDASDHMLRMVGERLHHIPDQTDTLSPEDTLSLDDTSAAGGVLLARTSTQVFMYLFRDLADETAIWGKVRRIQQALSEPVDVLGHSIVPAASLGLARYPNHGRTAAMLLKNVDTAQHRAASLGAGQAVMFCDALQATARERVTLEMALRRAVEHGRLELHYQPKVDAKSGRPVGAEALLRWHDPELGRVGPGRFIPVAEEAGLIGRIGSWVLRTACTQALQWRTQGLTDVRVSVNISATQFRQPEFVQMVVQTLTETGLPAQGLELELTESMLMRDIDLAIEHLTELRRLGVRIALDDFGTGYSSLSYLHRLPLDTLKVDRSFVIDMMNKPDAATVVRAVILLSHSLNLRVVAEGVEELDQLEELRKLGCDEIQGYYYSPALPAPGFERWMRDALGHQIAAVGR